MADFTPQSAATLLRAAVGSEQLFESPNAERAFYTVLHYAENSYQHPGGQLFALLQELHRLDQHWVVSFDHTGRCAAAKNGVAMFSNCAVTTLIATLSSHIEQVNSCKLSWQEALDELTSRAAGCGPKCSLSTAQLQKIVASQIQKGSS
jgi:hypothetical protein